MVDRAQQDVVVGSKLQHPHAIGRAGREIKRPGVLGGLQAGQVGLGSQREVQMRGGRRQQHLHWLAVHLAEPDPERFMPLGQFTQRSAQSRLIQWAAQAQCHRHRVGVTDQAEAVQQP